MMRKNDLYQTSALTPAGGAGQVSFMKSRSGKLRALAFAAPLALALVGATGGQALAFDVVIANSGAGAPTAGQTVDLAVAILQVQQPLLTG